MSSARNPFVKFRGDDNNSSLIRGEDANARVEEEQHLSDDDYDRDSLDSSARQPSWNDHFPVNR